MRFGERRSSHSSWRRPGPRLRNGDTGASRRIALRQVVPRLWQRPVGPLGGRDRLPAPRPGRSRRGIPAHASHATYPSGVDRRHQKFLWRWTTASPMNPVLSRGQAPHVVAFVAGRLRGWAAFLRDGTHGIPAAISRPGKSPGRSARACCATPPQAYGTSCSWGWASRCSTGMRWTRRSPFSIGPKGLGSGPAHPLSTVGILPNLESSQSAGSSALQARCMPRAPRCGAS